MWPFKQRSKPMTEEAYAATRPPAPCGNQKDHVFWTELNGLPCPHCADLGAQKRQEDTENRMAEKIAAAVVRKMPRHPAPDGEGLALSQILRTIPQQPQRQDATNAQLQDLRAFAIRLGLYDADNILRILLEGKSQTIEH